MSTTTSFRPTTSGERAPRERIQRLDADAASKHDRARKLIELWDEETSCRNLRRTTWVFEQAIGATISNTLALSIGEQMVFTVNEEGRWTCSFDFVLNRPFVWANWSPVISFSSKCHTRLVELDRFEFVGGSGLPQTTSKPWDARNGQSMIIDLPWAEGLPLLQVNDDGIQHEVRSGTSAALRHDFDRLWFAGRRIDGLFMMGTF